MKLLWSNLLLGGLYTDADADNDADADDDNNNDTWWTEHDCIGSLPNEPKSLWNSLWMQTVQCAFMQDLSQTLPWKEIAIQMFYNDIQCFFLRKYLKARNAAWLTVYDLVVAQ